MGEFVFADEEYRHSRAEECQGGCAAHELAIGFDEG